MTSGSLILTGLSEIYLPMIIAIEHSVRKITAYAIKDLDLRKSSGEVIGAFAIFLKT